MNQSNQSVTFYSRLRNQEHRKVHASPYETAGTNTKQLGLQNEWAEFNISVDAMLVVLEVKLIIIIQLIIK